jgi:hypothetical protein
MPPLNGSSMMGRRRGNEGKPVGLISGGSVAALLVLHAPMFAPVMQLAGLAAALSADGWHGRIGRRVANEEAVHAVSSA